MTAALLAVLLTAREARLDEAEVWMHEVRGEWPGGGW